MFFWDEKSGYNFQTQETVAQPGSLDSENAIYASTFDQTGARLLTVEGDKTVKVWKEDASATPDTHPIKFKHSFAKSKY